MSRVLKQVIKVVRGIGRLKKLSIFHDQMHEKGGSSCLQNNWQFGHSQLFSLTAEDKGAFAKVKDQLMKRNTFSFCTTHC